MPGGDNIKNESLKRNQIYIKLFINIFKKDLDTAIKLYLFFLKKECSMIHNE